MLKLELKRIFSKKINVFAIGLALILAVIFSGFAVTSNRYVDENGNASTGIMATRKLTDNRRAWKGTLTEDELGKVIEQNKNAVTQSSEENAIYGTTLQPIDDIRGFIISVLTPDAEYDESVLNQITEENVQQFYDTYHKNMEKMAEEYGKTSVQKKYLEKKYNEIKLPVEYESYSSWDTMIMYVETYSIILAIIVGFICAGIFADDFQTKADAVFFSTKYGRTKAVKTKILAGIATTVMIYCMGIILLSVICFGIMGTSGMNTQYMLMRTLKFIRGQQKKSIIISSGNYPNILFPGTLPKSSRILQDCIWPFLQQSCYHFYLFRIHEKIPMNYYIQSLLRQSNIYVGK